MHPKEDFGLTFWVQTNHVGCKARLLFKILDVKESFCSNCLHVNKNVCLNMLGAKQDSCSNILDAKQDFCFYILGASNIFYINILGAKQSKPFIQTFQMQKETFQTFWMQKLHFCLKPLCAKQDFCSNILETNQDFV